MFSLNIDGAPTAACHHARSWGSISEQFKVVSSRACFPWGIVGAYWRSGAEREGGLGFSVEGLGCHVKGAHHPSCQVPG